MRYNIQNEAFERLPKEKQQAILQSGIREFSTHSYKEARTDEITKNCAISKGLLFHYFGAKKNFYYYCLATALERLTERKLIYLQGDFYSIIFSVIDDKINGCKKWPEETLLTNMASRETAMEVLEEKNKMIAFYYKEIAIESARIMKAACSNLKFRETYKESGQKAITLYVNAVVNHFLKQYNDRPEEFFQKIDQIKDEMKEYLDCMLYGVVEEAEEEGL